MQAAATLIQAAHRGHTLRRKLNAQRQGTAVLVIQRSFKSFKLRSEVQRRAEARMAAETVRAQRLARAAAAEAERARMVKEREARRLADSLRNAEAKAAAAAAAAARAAAAADAAAARVAAAEREARLREEAMAAEAKRAAQARAAVAAEAAAARQRSAAAVEVQRVVRGHQGRRRVVGVMFNRGAVRLQALWRGHRSRGEVQRLRLRTRQPPSGDAVLQPTSPLPPPSPQFQTVVVEDEAPSAEYCATQIQKVRRLPRRGWWWR
jgi:hypothetical protein